MEPTFSQKRFLIPFTILLTLIMLFFGLRPKGLKLEDNVNWLGDRDGISIGKYGLTYADLKDGLAPVNENSGFSFEFAVRPSLAKGRGFKSIFMVHDGLDETQLIVGQWRSSIIVMNGHDYDNSKKTLKLVAVDVLPPGQTHLFAISSSRQGGTKLYRDGVLIKRSKALLLGMPHDRRSPYLVLGNSVYGHNTWRGDFFGFAVFPDVLSANQIRSHFVTWKDNGNLSALKTDQPLLLYLFAERQGHRARDYASGKYPLIIPRNVTTLKKNFLSFEWAKIKLDKSSLTDMSLNFLGFIPLGMVLIVLFSSFTPWKRGRLVMTSIGICFFMSFFFETVQAWMPSRSSSLLDLILNTLGGSVGCGIMIRHLVHHKIRPGYVD